MRAFTLGSQGCPSTAFIRFVPVRVLFCCSQLAAAATWSGNVAAPRICAVWKFWTKIVCSRPWGFAPEEVSVGVHLWHGLQDHLVPPEHAWQLASALPHCRAAFDPDEGHFFFRRRVEDIVTRLVEAAVVPIS